MVAASKLVTSLKYRNIAVSGKIATGTTTLAKNIQQALGWKYINAGDIQRRYDRDHGVNEDERGAALRPDDHEREIEAYTQKMLSEKEHLIYEAWLAGFVAKKIPGVLKVLIICSNDSVRVDRVVNRNNLLVEDAKRFIRTREEENIAKWKKIYGDHDFWDPKAFDLVIDTYSSGPMETLGKVLDAVGYKNHS